MSIYLTESELRNLLVSSILSEDLFQKSRKSGEGRVGLLGGETSDEKYDISKLSFKQIDLSPAAKVASDLHGKIGGAGVKESEGVGGKTIVSLVHEPLYDAIKGEGAMKRDKKGELSLFDYYSQNLRTNHWSSWFLNRCYLGSNGWAYIKAIAKGFEHSGCCYPYANIALNNRPKVFNNPESMKGKTMLMIFSKEEIVKSPDLDFKPGIASIVGGSGPDPDWENIRTTTKLVTGDKHMNVMVSDGKWIGGNLSNSTGVKNDDNKGGYMLLVKFIGLREEETSSAVA